MADVTYEAGDADHLKSTWSQFKCFIGVNSAMCVLNLIFIVDGKPLPDIQSERTVWFTANISNVSTTSNVHDRLSTGISIYSRPKKIDTTTETVDRIILQPKNVHTELILESRNEGENNESNAISTQRNQGGTTSQSGRGIINSRSKTVGMHKFLSFLISKRKSPCVGLNQVKRKIKTVYNFCRSLLTDYCGFVRNDPTNLLSTISCHQLELSSPIPISRTLITNVTSLMKDIASYLKTTADRIYNISFIVLLQEECYPCDDDSLQSLTARSLSSLTSDHPIFNQFIHFTHILEDAISTLICSQNLAQKRVPPSSVLRKVMYHTENTKSVITELTTVMSKLNHFTIIL